ncbi:hypothetical protein M8C21_021472 [Ambrosia artemisiifolia]|uniref:Uncharacterized protein n=1 Tax=Ambrosia artemisiifolia TaxID=4212 RepID=A0AAD5G7Y5_AMBAR|nr:hypothetical protein M8C21_021472 [Ambrosia artemisiifolia]
MMQNMKMKMNQTLILSIIIIIIINRSGRKEEEEDIIGGRLKVAMLFLLSPPFPKMEQLREQQGIPIDRLLPILQLPLKKKKKKTTLLSPRKLIWIQLTFTPTEMMQVQIYQKMLLFQMERSYL